MSSKLASPPFVISHGHCHSLRGGPQPAPHGSQGQMEAGFCVQGGAQPVGFVFLKHNNTLARLLRLCPLPTEHGGGPP